MSAYKRQIQLSRLWKKSAFHSMLEPGKLESEDILDRFHDILAAYTSFEKSVLHAIKELRRIKLNLPAIAKIRDEIAGSRFRIQKFIEQETGLLSNVINDLGEFRFMLRKSQLNASHQYLESIKEFLAAKDERTGHKKLESMLYQLKGLSKAEKKHICENPHSTQFEKWITNFDLRTEDFFLKAYKVEWQDEASVDRIPFIRLKHEYHFKNLFAQGSVEASAVEAQSNQPVEQSDGNEQMEEEQNDIVSQIYKELREPHS